MDLIILILVVVLVGFVLHLILTKVPMQDEWRTIIRIFAALVLLIFLLRRLGVGIPNML